MRINVKLKLAALWTSVMFLYIYGDYFDLYKPGTVQNMLKGEMNGLGPATQGVLIGTTAMMIVPSLMVFLSVALNAVVNRWLNIVMGVLYTVIIIVTVSHRWVFDMMLGAFEILLTLLVVWYAARWPRATQP